MKKIIISLVILSVFTLSSNAQQWLETKAGGGLALVQGYNGASGGLAAFGGLGYKHQVSKRLMLEADLLMDTRAVIFPTNVLDANDDVVNFIGGGTYLQVPITVQFMTPFKKRKKLVPYRMGVSKSYWFIEGGPYVSYGLGVAYWNDPAIIAAEMAVDDSIPASNLEARKIDVGVTLGLGINFSLKEGKRRLIIGTRTNYGMLSVYKDKRLGSATNLSAVGYLAYDIILTKRKHIKHRW